MERYSILSIQDRIYRLSYVSVSYVYFIFSCEMIRYFTGDTHTHTHIYMSDCCIKLSRTWTMDSCRTSNRPGMIVQRINNLRYPAPSLVENMFSSFCKMIMIKYWSKNWFLSSTGQRIDFSQVLVKELVSLEYCSKNWFLSSTRQRIDVSQVLVREWFLSSTDQRIDFFQFVSHETESKYPDCVVVVIIASFHV